MFISAFKHHVIYLTILCCFFSCEARIFEEKPAGNDAFLLTKPEFDVSGRRLLEEEEWPVPPAPIPAALDDGDETVPTDCSGYFALGLCLEPTASPTDVKSFVERYLDERNFLVVCVLLDLGVPYRIDGDGIQFVLPNSSACRASVQANGNTVASVVASVSTSG